MIRFPFRRVPNLLMLIAAGFFLVACDSAEERAEKHFASALELIEKGEFERAEVEFRNVFKLNGEHRDARAAYAAMQRQRGILDEAFGQYLRLVEQNPDDLEGNLALAELFAETGGWEEMGRFTDKLQEIAAEDPRTKMLNALRGYRLAVAKGDDQAIAPLAARVKALWDEQPDNLLLAFAAIDEAARKGDFEEAVRRTDRALEFHPQERRLWNSRLAILAAIGDGLRIEQQLLDNIQRFPDEDSLGMALVRYYISQNLIDEGENFLRKQVADHPEDDARKRRLIHYLAEMRGEEAAVAELDAMIAAGQVGTDFQAMRAELIFDMGRRQDAIADMRSRIADMPQGPELQDLRMTLARMYLAEGEEAAARELVDQILAEDSANAEALKLRAIWLVEEDRTSEAIAALRTALDETPNDPEIYTALALAHQRDGNIELMGDMLSLAVDASENAAEQSLQYSGFLLDQGKTGPAESVVIEALRRDPVNPRLLAELGRVYLAMRDWARLDQVIATLDDIPGDTARTLADRLRADELASQDRAEEAVELLKGLARQGQAAFETDTAIVQTYLAQDDVAAAQRYIEEELQSRPDDFGLRFLRASTTLMAGDPAAAEREFLALAQEDPSQNMVWLALFRMYDETGREADKRAILERALAALPDDGALLWAKASLAEQDGDIDGAIAIYERLYAQDSDNVIIANNLASLMVQRDTSPEVVNRAYVIARRLRTSDIPPLQDTYGWIAVLRGDHAEAIRMLEPAAAAMAQDPMVQYHLARAYFGAQRLVDARDQFQKVLDMVPADDARDFVRDSRQKLAELSAMPDLINQGQ